MVCDNCHTDNPDGAKFCGACGAPLSAKARPPRELAATPAPPAASPLSRPSGGTEEFSGAEPNYGKIPWVQIALLAFFLFITWAALSSGRVVGPLNYSFILLMTLLAINIARRLMLKPTKVYYVITPSGLTYLDAGNSMATVAWTEMDRLEGISGRSPEQLRLHWRGHREIPNTFKWFDRLMTRLTGKVYKGGLPLEEGETTPRAVDLDAAKIAQSGATFGERFQARFAERA